MRFTAASISALQFFMLALNASCFNIPYDYEFNRNASEGFIIVFVQKIIRPFISRGCLEYGIPILDPLRLDEIGLKTNNPEIGKLNITLYNSTIRGLKRFVIDRVRLSLIGPTIMVNVTIPKLRVRGKYNLTADIGKMYHVFGTGPLKISASNFHVFLKTSLSVSNAIKLTNLTVDFFYDDMDVHFENFMNGSESGIVMSEVLRRILPQAVEILKPEVLLRIENFIASAINNIIYQFTSSLQFTSSAAINLINLCNDFCLIMKSLISNSS